MDKNGIFLFVLFSAILLLMSSCFAATNVARGKSYSVFPVQNYPLSAPPTNTTALTDGSYSVGRFWTQKNTVGWQKEKSVEILIDLENNANIDRIIFSTARGEKDGVYYPEQIAAFVGSDRDHLFYVGDLAVDPENQPGQYHVKQFVLNNVGKRARFVFLEVIPKGLFLFCDEIEVTEGEEGNEPRGTLSIVQARMLTDKIRRTGVKKILNNPGGVLNSIATTRKVTKYPQKTDVRALSLDDKKDLDITESKMFEFRNTVLKKQFPNSKILIQLVKPWDQLSPSIFPDSIQLHDLIFCLPRNGYDYKSILITSLSKKAQTFFLFLGNAPTGVELSTYQVPFAKTLNKDYIADPLVSTIKSFTLRPGESRIVFVMARGTKSGTWRHVLQIRSGEQINSIPIVVKVVNLKLPNSFLLNANSWGYLNYKLTRDRQQAVINDLLMHHNHVVVVPPPFLPISNLPKEQDFDGLKKYLNIASRGASKVLLYVNFKPSQRSNVNGKYPFMSDEWKNWFKSWYDELTKTVVNIGISKNQLYFYPYDEMDGKCVDDFIAFATWAKKELPGIQFYATINNKRALKAISYLDIAQVLNYVELLKAIKSTKTELWLYEAREPAKSLSPYSYYRLMAWTAFLHNYKGIGFWAYADSTKATWDDSDGEERDFGVIYKGEGNSIISSRRWEAWRMGIEDYELLTMYSKAKGDVAAKRLAKSVLDNPLDTTRADEVRKKILLELSK